VGFTTIGPRIPNLAGTLRQILLLHGQSEYFAHCVGEVVH